MIRLSCDNLLVVNASGEEETLDSDAVLLRLERAFAAHGIRERWMAEHLVLLLEDAVRERHACGRQVSEDDITGMLRSMLTVSGYEDVAVSYLRLLNAPDEAGGDDGAAVSEAHVEAKDESWLGNLREWDVLSVEELLEKTLPASSEQRAGLAKDCLDALARLGFSNATEVFVCELAFHLLHSPKTAAAPCLAEQPDGRCRFIPADAWLDVVESEKVRLLMKCGILTPLPVSDIFPAARARLCMTESLVDDLDEGIGKMLFAENSLCMTCECAVQLLNEMRKRIADIWPRFESPAMQLTVALAQKPASINGHKGGAERLLKERIARFIGKLEPAVRLAWK